MSNPVRFRHICPGCPLDGREGTQVQPDPRREPPSFWNESKCAKILFDGEREARWIALSALEFVWTHVNEDPAMERTPS